MNLTDAAGVFGPPSAPTPVHPLFAAIDSALAEYTEENKCTLEKLAADFIALKPTPGELDLANNYRTLAEYTVIWIRTRTSICAYQLEHLDMSDEVKKADEVFKNAYDFIRKDTEAETICSGIPTHVLRVNLQQNETFISRIATYRKIERLASQIPASPRSQETIRARVSKIVTEAQQLLKIHDRNATVSPGNINQIYKSTCGKLERLQTGK